ncbi:hypothetical protein [Marinisporobacter balticus]|uniref:Uncharacterized protein n=1 Tax=Marinisporobacter balticus TaxID=2018667 RepID=A0A4R2KQF3_9FIRM|nr:hypothetical protein [Marinisporobacter balticus]TCO73149.1 hypothetical protein EV214_11651 [Marinisporobacter balticus]
MQKRRKAFFIILSTCMVILSFSYIVMAMGTDPGSQEDPIITKSYVELRNQQLKFYIDQKIEELSVKTNNEKQTNLQTPVFEIVEVQKGQRVIGGASTEIIIRSGGALAIASASGGVADLISGKDLKNGEIIPLNHLLLLPRDDGRGIEVFVDKTFILIKGSYGIQ